MQHHHWTPLQVTYSPMAYWFFFDTIIFCCKEEDEKIYWVKMPGW